MVLTILTDNEYLWLCRVRSACFIPWLWSTVTVVPFFRSWLIFVHILHYPWLRWIRWVRSIWFPCFLKTSWYHNKSFNFSLEWCRLFIQLCLRCTANTFHFRLNVDNVWLIENYKGNCCQYEAQKEDYFGPWQCHTSHLALYQKKKWNLLLAKR